MSSPAELLVALYGEQAGRAAHQRLAELMDRHRPHIRAGAGAGLTERDALLITYADQVREPGLRPMRSLADFSLRHLAGLVSGIHLLPFYPSSSDQGFSVIDYRTVDPALGDWDDVARLGRRFRLMFDAVFNHVSARSRWFQGFLADDPAYGDYFILVPEKADLSLVVRPRASPLLTRFVTPSGERRVWTTFSGDQIDLNYANPAVLLEMIDILLYYVSRGAELIRLDAAAFLWKQIGTPCIHLPQTHRIIHLFRAVLDELAPQIALISEANVPHRENISYFGDGANEAQLVYNFALPPLVLHTLQTGSAETLRRWAAALAPPSGRAAFFNFLASHDGIGVRPVRGILSEREVGALAERALSHGGLVSCADGPYELNINYFDALSDPESDETIDTQVDRFMVAQAIMLALAGVPGIYFHSLFGSRGWPEGVRLGGGNRAINRQKCDRALLEGELSDEGSLRSAVFRRYKRLLRARAAHPSFHPQGEQRVLDFGEAVLALLRRAPNGGEQVLCLHNVTGRPQTVELDLRSIFGSQPDRLTDLTAEQSWAAAAGFAATLSPYQALWLRPGGEDHHG